MCTRRLFPRKVQCARIITRDSRQKGQSVFEGDSIAGVRNLEERK
jgi:hypothetical protein